jgi:hypothetical protein
MAARQSLTDRAREAIRNMMGVSAYEKPRGYGLDIDDHTVEEIREALGGQIQPQTNTRLRWYIADLETAQFQADDGNLLMAAQLYRAMNRDGVLAGLLGTRTGGLVRLPKRFYGDSEIAEQLQAKNGSRSVFEEMFPSSELSMLARDGIQLGVGVGELVPVADRDYPVFVRLDPENLQYRWVENRWYFRSTAGLLPVTPGDGRWILHTPGARLSPWNAALWPATGESWINKQHAKLNRSNFSMKLANPARVATTPLGAGETQKKGFFRKVAAWGINTVFDLPPGWGVSILSVGDAGRSIEVWQKEIDTSDLEFMVAIAGQLVSTTGGTGFSNEELPRRIREDLIRNDGDCLAYTLNTQGLPCFIASRFGVDAITKRATTFEWETATPKELESEARTLGLIGPAISQLVEVLSKVDRELDLDALMQRFGVPMKAANDVSDATEGLAKLSLVGEDGDVEKAVASLYAVLPPAARRLSLDRLHRIHVRAA